MTGKGLVRALMMPIRVTGKAFAKVLNVPKALTMSALAIAVAVLCGAEALASGGTTLPTVTFTPLVDITSIFEGIQGWLGTAVAGIITILIALTGMWFIANNFKRIAR